LFAEVVLGGGKKSRELFDDRLRRGRRGGGGEVEAVGRKRRRRGKFGGRIGRNMDGGREGTGRGILVVGGGGGE
jgi:hypothetical protein